MDKVLTVGELVSILNKLTDRNEKAEKYRITFSANIDALTISGGLGSVDIGKDAIILSAVNAGMTS